MAGFIFQTTRNIFCELGASKKLGSIVAETVALHNSSKTFNTTRKGTVMLITDNGIKKAKLEQEAVKSIQNEGFDVQIYSDVVADPPEKYILEAVDLAKSHNVCGVVGLGGGSSMDVAKVVSLLAHRGCQQSLSELYGVNQCKGNRLPLFQIPTTAGTGSEVTPISIITTGENEKKGIVSPQLLPDWAVVDGNLTASVPPHVAAATGIDAMVHAIEAYTCKTRKNPMSDMLALEALRLLSGSIHTVCAAPNTVSGDESGIARSNMLLGSLYAGIAFANAPVAAVHALAYPIGSIYHVPHGLSNALMLPHVIRFNSKDVNAQAQYSTISNAIVFGSQTVYKGGAGMSLADRFVQLSKELDVPPGLSAVGIASQDIDKLASEAMKQTRLLPNNPREVTLSDAANLYASAM